MVLESTRTEAIFEREISNILRRQALIPRVKERYAVLDLGNERSVHVIQNQHPFRVGTSSSQLAKVLGLTNLPELEMAAYLHDAGKAHEDVLPLMKRFRRKSFENENQRDIVRRAHTKLGPAVLDLIEKTIGFDGFPMDRSLADDICRYHHPEIDPYRCSRRLEVKIVSVVDKFDAMTTCEDEEERAHRPPKSEARAVEILWETALKGELDQEVCKVFIEQCLAMPIPTIR